jgi:plasmid stabilization system protein ParE
VPQLSWSEASLSDLASINEYLVQFDADIAVRMLLSIRDASRILTSFPAAGPVVDLGHRSLRVRQTPYVLIYAIRDDEVTILHVRHTREDWRQP